MYTYKNSPASVGNGGVWCYEPEKHSSQTKPKQRRSSAAPVLTLLFHMSWPAWVTLGFSRICQELTSEWLMPHLTRKYSFFAHTNRKLLSSSWHTLEAFLRETTQVLGARQQQRLPKEDDHLEYLPSEFLSELKPFNQPSQLYRNLFWELHNDQVSAPYHNTYSLL